MHAYDMSYYQILAVHIVLVSFHVCLPLLFNFVCVCVCVCVSSTHQHGISSNTNKGPVVFLLHSL